MTPKKRREIFDRYEGQCDGCGVELEFTAPWTADHIIPFEISHDDSVDNMHPLCSACDPLKTYGHDIPTIAKVKRIARKHTEPREPRMRSPKRKLCGRGFDKTRTRKLNGKVVIRTPKA